MIPFFVILLYGMKIHFEINQGHLGLNESCAIRGACSFYILIWHIQMFTDLSGIGFSWLSPTDGAKILSNGIFFFLSGYGLWWSVEHKKGYLSATSLFERLLNIGIPAYLSYLLFVLLVHGSEMEKLVKGIFLKYVVDWIRYNDVVWFLIELVILYVLFWGLYRAFSTKIANIVLGIIVVAWEIFAFYWGRGLVWYASTLCFLVGILLSQSKSRKGITENLNRLLIVCFIVFAISYSMFLILPNFNVWGYLFFSNLSTIAFVELVYLLTLRVRFGNRLINWLGNISYELYLVHMIVIKMVNYYTDSRMLRVYGVILLSICMAILCGFLTKKIKNCINAVRRMV